MLDPASFGWTTASHGLDTSEPAIMRLCRIPRDFARAPYPERIHVYWKMKHTHPSGLPLRAEDRKLEAFESELAGAMLPGNHAVLVATITGRGTREFVFYVRDVDGFKARLQAMPHPDGPYPITLEQYDDAAWAIYDALVGKLPN